MNNDQRTRLEIMRALDKDFPDRLLEDLVYAARYVEHGGAEPEPPEPDETSHMPDEPRKWTSLAHIPDNVRRVKDHDGDLIKRLVTAKQTQWVYASHDYANIRPTHLGGPFTEVPS